MDPFAELNPFKDEPPKPVPPSSQPLRALRSTHPPPPAPHVVRWTRSSSFFNLSSIAYPSVRPTFDPITGYPPLKPQTPPKSLLSTADEEESRPKPDFATYKFDFIDIPVLAKKTVEASGHGEGTPGRSIVGSALLSPPESPQPPRLELASVPDLSITTSRDSEKPDEPDETEVEKPEEHVSKLTPTKPSMAVLQPSRSTAYLPPTPPAKPNLAVLQPAHLASNLSPFADDFAPIPRVPSSIPRAHVSLLPTPAPTTPLIHSAPATSRSIKSRPTTYDNLAPSEITTRLERLTMPLAGKDDLAAALKEYEEAIDAGLVEGQSPGHGYGTDSDDEPQNRQNGSLVLRASDLAPDVLGLTEDTDFEVVEAPPSYLSSLGRGSHLPDLLSSGEGDEDDMPALNGSSHDVGYVGGAVLYVPDHEELAEDNLGESAYDRYRSSTSPRLSVPSAVHNACRLSPLQRTIIQSWIDAEPNPSMTRAVTALLQELTRTVNSATKASVNGSRERFKVDVFGSMAWGGDTGGSADLDLVIIDRHVPMGYTPTLWRVPPGEAVSGASTRRRRVAGNGSLPAVYDMNRLAMLLRNTLGVRNCQAIPHASTPIVKFQTVMGLQCDVNVNDLGGWYNSKLILAYCEISPFVLRPMIHTLKKWLSEHQLNDRSGAVLGQGRSMSSYCITLMAIAYLQHIGMLPNLQENVYAPPKEDPTDTSEPNTIWVSWGFDQGQVARISFDPEPHRTWRPKLLNYTAAQAVKGFFEYYGTQRGFKPNDQFVSPLNGGIVSRRHPKNYETNQRHIYRRTLVGNTKERIQELMKMYDEANPNRDAWVGKCDRSRPRAWGDNRLVVQDPFLWQKNCAKNMARDAVERFFRLAAATYRHIENDAATLTSIMEVAI